MPDAPAQPAPPENTGYIVVGTKFGEVKVSMRRLHEFGITDNGVVFQVLAALDLLAPLQEPAPD